MSLPDDETRDPQDQDNLQPEEDGAGWTEESLGLGDDPMGDSLFDPSLLADSPDAEGVSPNDESGETLDFAAPAGSESGIAFQAMGMDDDAAEAADESDADEASESLDFAAPVDTESGLAFQAMGMDDEVAEAADADEAGESLDFAAPADAESGVAFGAMGADDDNAADTEGDEFLAGVAGDLDTFGGAGVDVDAHVSGVDDDEFDKEPTKGLFQRILCAVGGTDPYTVLMGIALVALLCGILFFYLELASYDFDFGAEKAKQLVGLAGFGWL
ncbi:MAG: hypothetical protein U1E05_00325, partial [Patescibacteria group bacterium]|nr:hypothetical protein [Patescibacteria group bacterium]